MDLSVAANNQINAIIAKFSETCPSSPTYLQDVTKIFQDLDAFARRYGRLKIVFPTIVLNFLAHYLEAVYIVSTTNSELLAYLQPLKILISTLCKKEVFRLIGQRILDILSDGVENANKEVLIDFNLDIIKDARQHKNVEAKKIFSLEEMYLFQLMDLIASTSNNALKLKQLQLFQLIAPEIDAQVALKFFPLNLPLQAILIKFSRSETSVESFVQSLDTNRQIYSVEMESIKIGREVLKTSKNNEPFRIYADFNYTKKTISFRQSSGVTQNCFLHIEHDNIVDIFSKVFKADSFEVGVKLKRLVEHAEIKNLRGKIIRFRFKRQFLQHIPENPFMEKLFGKLPKNVEGEKTDKLVSRCMRTCQDNVTKSTCTAVDHALMATCFTSTDHSEHVERALEDSFMVRSDLSFGSFQADIQSNKTSSPELAKSLLNIVSIVPHETGHTTGNRNCYTLNTTQKTIRQCENDKTTQKSTKCEDLPQIDNAEVESIGHDSDLSTFLLKFTDRTSDLQSNVSSTDNHLAELAQSLTVANTSVKINNIESSPKIVQKVRSDQSDHTPKSRKDFTFTSLVRNQSIEHREEMRHRSVTPTTTNNVVVLQNIVIPTTPKRGTCNEEVEESAAELSAGEPLASSTARKDSHCTDMSQSNAFHYTTISKEDVPIETLAKSSFMTYGKSIERERLRTYFEPRKEQTPEEYPHTQSDRLSTIPGTNNSIVDMDFVSEPEDNNIFEHLDLDALFENDEEMVFVSERIPDNVPIDAEHQDNIPEQQKPIPEPEVHIPHEPEQVMISENHDFVSEPMENSVSEEAEHEDEIQDIPEQQKQIPEPEVHIPDEPEQVEISENHDVVSEPMENSVSEEAEHGNLSETHEDIELTSGPIDNSVSDEPEQDQASEDDSTVVQEIDAVENSSDENAEDTVRYTEDTEFDMQVRNMSKDSSSSLEEPQKKRKRPRKLRQRRPPIAVDTSVTDYPGSTSKDSKSSSSPREDETSESEKSLVIHRNIRSSSTISKRKRKILSDSQLNNQVDPTPPQNEYDPEQGKVRRTDADKATRKWFRDEVRRIRLNTLRPKGMDATIARHLQNFDHAPKSIQTALVGTYFAIENALAALKCKICEEDNLV